MLVATGVAWGIAGLRQGDGIFWGSGLQPHNHPSGTTEPSKSDELLTSTLKQALALLDVRVLDHFIVAGNQTMSFAERGLI